VRGGGEKRGSLILAKSTRVRYFSPIPDHGFKIW
jgi:hypothetical protein